MPKGPRVVIPTLKFSSWIANALDALFEGHLYQIDEIIITDDGSDESTCDSLLELTERFPMSTTLCEPQLGKRGLYPNTSIKGGYGDVRMMMDVLSLADGITSIQTISNMLSMDKAQVGQIISMFQREELVLE